MDSIENGATIRIGLQERYKEHSSEVEYLTPTYSLKIDKKTVFNSKTTENYLESCMKAAEEIAKMMKEKGVKNYVIFNGERVRYSTSKWESCEYIPKDGEELFKKTLEATLND